MVRPIYNINENSKFKSYLYTHKGHKLADFEILKFQENEIILEFFMYGYVVRFS